MLCATSSNAHLPRSAPSSLERHARLLRRTLKVAKSVSKSQPVTHCSCTNLGVSGTHIHAVRLSAPYSSGSGFKLWFLALAFGPGSDIALALSLSGYGLPLGSDQHAMPKVFFSQQRAGRNLMILVFVVFGVGMWV